MQAYIQTMQTQIQTIKNIRQDAHPPIFVYKKVYCSFWKERKKQDKSCIYKVFVQTHPITCCVLFVVRKDFFGFLVYFPWIGTRLPVTTNSNVCGRWVGLQNEHNTRIYTEIIYFNFLNFHKNEKAKSYWDNSTRFDTCSL